MALRWGEGSARGCVGECGECGEYDVFDGAVPFLDDERGAKPLPPKGGTVPVPPFNPPPRGRTPPTPSAGNAPALPPTRSGIISSSGPRRARGTSCLVFVRL